MAYSDRELLARLIECEAGGEGETGMKAVASVVMNRVHVSGGEYARVGKGSIRNIIFQPGQFVCASETERGAYNPQNIYNMRPETIHYEIADWAIAGNRLPVVAESLWFYNPFVLYKLNTSISQKIKGLNHTQCAGPGRIGFP